MNVLGISAGFSHDASACILIDGKIIYAIEEERIIRKKYAEHKRPIYAIKSCLDFCNLTLNDIDVVAISWNPYNFSSGNLTPDDEMFFKALFPNSMYGNYEKPYVHIVDHHIAHAAHVFWNSQLNQSCILVMDGTGEMHSGSVFIGDREKGIRKLYTFDVGESLGYFYQAASSYCGLGYLGTGKLMGLAAYGKKEDFIFDNIILDNVKGYKIDNRRVSFEDNMKYWYNKFSEYQYTPNFFSKREIFTPEYIDFASKVQSTLNNVMINVTNVAIAETKIANVCFSGGVSMNSAVNLCIAEQTSANNVFTFPGGGDAGSSIGAAMQAYFESTGTPCEALADAYLGNEISNDEIRLKLSEYNLNAKYLESDQVLKTLSDILVSGQSIGVVQGREEFGARALGNRSILFNPKIENGRSKLNYVKKREVWRPFAPVISEKCFADYLYCPYQSNYMTANFRVTNEGKLNMREAIHIDDTCRPQMALSDSFIGTLLNEYYSNTGSGALLNTSFNTKGNPIVHTIDDALKEYYTSGMDCLLLGNYLLLKNAKER